MAAATSDISDSRAEYGAYKYQWARYVARKKLDEDIRHLKQSAIDGNVPELTLADSDGKKFLRDIVSGKKVIAGEPPKKPGEFKVGIVGAGVAGLFTGLIIDYLNGKLKDKLNITYDILEAAGPERLGGRLYTYKFSERKHDYYDVGAMRFPNNIIMARTFKLFDFIGIGTIWKGEDDFKKLIPYYLEDQDEPNGVCPSYYNDIRQVGKFKQYYVPPKEKTHDPSPFQVNSWLDQNDPNRIPHDLLKEDPTKIVGRLIEKFSKEVQETLDNNMTTSKDPELTEDELEKVWRLLNVADFMSTREYFRVKDIPKLTTEELKKALEHPGRLKLPDIKGADLNFNTIEWLETFAYATGWYNQGLSETVLESLDFDTPGKNPFAGPGGPKNDFYCIEGGTQQVATMMASKLMGPQPEFHRQVTAIVTDTKNTGNIKLKIKHNNHPDAEIEEREYFTVFNSTTLGALQRMDLTKADLNYGTKQAIRSLAYGASCKVGMKFRTAWWMLPPHNINQGGVSKTDLPLRVCVYPSYNIHDNPHEPAVLLCSYTWAQDAQRMGALISPTSPDNEEELKNLLFHNLALLHASDEMPYENLLALLKDQYITHYAYDWYNDPNMSGAFAYFGPGQFANMWPQIIKPNGWLFLIGEAASAHHAWIVGALESAVRGVYQLLEQLELQRHEQGSKFDGYKEAMELLETPATKADEELPFVGLPREMPLRQAGTAKKDSTQSTPEDSKVDLSFVAAQCLVSFYELYTEIERQKQMHGGNNKGT